jgi:hypothetical protein
MQKHFSKFMQSAVALPLFATHIAISPILGAAGMAPTAVAILPETNRPLQSETLVNQQEHAVKVQKVEAFFSKYGRPLAEHADKLVTEAEKNGLDWKLVAALGQVESSGGAHACPNDRANAFGYGSCHGVVFGSFDDAIETVASTIAGNNKATAHYYQDKDLKTKLEVYNGRANLKYVDNVLWVMDQIEKQPIAQSAPNAKA